MGRVIAQRLLTGEFLDWDVPLKDPKRVRELSGPGGISGIINPEMRNRLARDGRPILDEWSTALYYEQDNTIRCGGIVQSIQWQGPVMEVNAPGFASYPAGQPIVRNYVPKKWEDPVRVFRNLWNYTQSFERGNIGVKVTGPDTYLVLGDGEGPYNIRAKEYRDIGQELDIIAQAAPFDYIEKHAWTDTSRTRISHKIKIGFPRIGRLRDDLRLAQGENLISMSTIGLDGERFANSVYVLGNGEGEAMAVGRASKNDGRLRRAMVIPYKHARKGLARIYAEQELRGRSMLFDISEVVVREHPNAPIAALSPGDDIPLDIDVPHIGRTQMNLRVLAVEESAGDRATIKTMRSEFFTYRPDRSPTGKTVRVEV